MLKYALPLLLLLAACQPSATQTPSSPATPLPATEISGSLIREEHLTSALPLAATTGEKIVLNQANPHIALVAFGYTSCPDVCPTTLLTMGHAMKMLTPQQAAEVKGYFITLDPDRDTLEVLKGYVTLFHPDFIGLRPEAQQLAQIKQDWRVVGDIVPLENGNYTVDHSTGIYFIDKQGQTAVYEPYGTTARQLAADIALFLKENP